MAKNVNKFRKNGFYEDDYEYDKGYMYSNRKKKIASEVKKEKNKVTSRLRHPSYDEVLRMTREDDWS